MRQFLFAGALSHDKCYVVRWKEHTKLWKQLTVNNLQGFGNLKGLRNTCPINYSLKISFKGLDIKDGK